MGRERFLDEPNALLQNAVKDNRVVGVPRRVQDPDLWTQRMEVREQVTAVHRRHHDIRQQEMNRLPVLARETQGLVAPSSDQHRVAAPRQHRAGDGADFRLVLG